MICHAISISIPELYRIFATSTGSSNACAHESVKPKTYLIYVNKLTTIILQIQEVPKPLSSGWQYRASKYMFT
jgi:hypothetical protein